MPSMRERIALTTGLFEGHASGYTWPTCNRYIVITFIENLYAQLSYAYAQFVKTALVYTRTA